MCIYIYYICIHLQLEQQFQVRYLRSSLYPDTIKASNASEIWVWNLGTQKKACGKHHQTSSFSHWYILYSASICYILINFPIPTWWLIPRIVSGLVHPSYFSGLTRSLSHVNHWGYNPLTKWDEPPSISTYFQAPPPFSTHSKGRPRLSWYRPGATRFWRLFFVDVLRRFCWWELNIYHKLWCIFVKGGIFYDRMTGFFKKS